MRAACNCLVFVLLAAVPAACGPSNRDRDPDGLGADAREIDAPVELCYPAPEICDDGRDNDCDERFDCNDNDCSGVGSCPVCGSVNAPESQPLALPDGIGQSAACTTNAQCSAALPNCVHDECHASYTSTLNFVGFVQGGKLPDANQVFSVCVKMEHSWLRDLQMDLITPDDRVLTLHAFVDRMGGEIYLGEADDSDGPSNPVPGVGHTYCWKPTGAATMLSSPTVSMNGHQMLPAGDYASVSPWSLLQGAPLNGPWTMRVTDLWPQDNGFMFEWSIAFDPKLIRDCTGPIVQ